MIKILNTALALAAVGSLGFAGTNGSDWTGLDKDMSLATADSHMKGGPSMGALVRSSLSFSSDDAFAIGGEDLQGVLFQNAKLWAQGEVGQFWWRMSFDFADAGQLQVGAVLEDAYASWKCNSDQLSVMMGQFKPSIARSANVSDGSLLFISRSVIGLTFDSYDPGIAVNGHFEQFSWQVSANNGADGAAEDLDLYARGEYNFNGGAGCCEGGYGKPDGTTGTIGLGYGDFEDLDDKVLVLDGAVSFSRFALGAEWADFDNADQSLFAVSGSYMIQPETWEVAVRYEDLDTSDDNTILTGGVNWYHGGHNAKWQLNFTDFSSDVDADEGTVIQLGLTVGCTGGC
jgi:hypothetical protein